MKILIADSDWQFEVQATKYFESHADNVYRETPRNLADRAKTLKADLVILAAEYATPETLNALRQLDCRPAVLITEHMSRFDRAWGAWQCGGDELLMKPVLQGRELQQAAVTAMERAAVCPDWTTRQTAIPA